MSSFVFPHTSFTAPAKVIVGRYLQLSRPIIATCPCTGISDNNISKLQRVQIILVRVLTGTKKRDHTVLRKLHWLPVSTRIELKIAVILLKIRSSCICHFQFSRLRLNGFFALLEQTYPMFLRTRTHNIEQSTG